MDRPVLVAIYADSTPGYTQSHLCMAAIDGLGYELVRAGYGLVYNGAHQGIAWQLAEVMFGQRHGVTIGVMPRDKQSQLEQYEAFNELVWVNSETESQNTIADMADAYVVMPGGIQQEDELLKLIASQSPDSSKPFIIFDLGSCYRNLLARLEREVRDGLVNPEYRKHIRTARSVKEVMHWLTLRYGEVVQCA
jgi:uncharacterized protein (TIGR00730 family)